MQTVLTDSPAEAAAFLNQGELVAFPTETVYGLGADCRNDAAVSTIFTAKGRPSDNPLIVHISDPSRASLVAGDISPSAQLLMQRFFPGPLTVVLKKNDTVSPLVSAGLPTIGIRCPAHHRAREFLRLCHHPVAAPSANISGRPSSTDWQTVSHDLAGKIRCILKGEQSSIGVESTIVDCTGSKPVLLRTGAISRLDLENATGCMIADATRMTDEQPKSPGQKYQHYAPQAEVILYEHDTPPAVIPLKAGCISLGDPLPGCSITCRCHSLEEYAHHLFRFFRRCDISGAKAVYCELPPASGIGSALRDRLQRAAGHR